MPIINMSYMLQNEMAFSKKFKKEIFFDIIGGIPSLPSLSLFHKTIPPNDREKFIRMVDMEEMRIDQWNMEYAKEKVIPLSHPLRVVLGIPPYNTLLEFNIPLYVYPQFFVKLSPSLKNSCSICWMIAEKINKKEYDILWEMERYKNFYHHFPSLLPKDYEFILHMFVLEFGRRKDFYDNDENFLPSLSYMYKKLLPEISSDVLDEVIISPTVWFPNGEFPSLFVDKPSSNTSSPTKALYHLREFQIRDSK